MKWKRRTKRKRKTQAFSLSDSARRPIASSHGETVVSVQENVFPAIDHHHPSQAENDWGPDVKIQTLTRSWDEI
jgi:hypothetical protein